MIAPVRFGRVVIVGGGCYGTFYARQLARARAEAKVEIQQLLVVDRNPGCRLIREQGESPGWRLVVEDWDTFFDGFLTDPGAEDAIVPSPLMPHLMYGWLLRRARGRWPHRTVETRPLAVGPETPYDMAAPDDTRYVSFADWLCPTHCIEPGICPATRAPRTWEMEEAAAVLAGRLGARGPALFTCRHQVFGVGMFSVAEVLAGDALVGEAGAAGQPVEILVGTVSACHGALNLLRLGSS